MSKRVIIYHGNCYDGFGAAWAAWKKFGDSAEYIPAFYGMPFPDSAWDCDCYVLDFSFPAKVIGDRQLDESYVLNLTDFKVIDHHMTAEVDLKEYPGCCIFDMNKSGAMLAWDFFHPGSPAPHMIEYLQDRDLWRFTLPGSRGISSYMRSWPFEFAVWERIAAEMESLENIALIANEGENILRFQDQMVKVMADQSWIENIGGYKVPVANATVFFSEVGEELCLRNPDKPFAAYFIDRKDGKRQWGLKSRGEFDVSEVAKGYGGGGHKNAAGFTEVRPAKPVDEGS